MDQRKITEYTSKTHDALQDAKNMIKTNKKILNVFVPGKHEDMYMHRFFDKNSRFPCFSVLNSISVLKTEIHLEISKVLKADSDALHGRDNQSDIRKVSHLQESLEAMEHTIIQYPLSTFVRMVIQKGTILDFVGIIEKLKYDKLYGDIPENWSEIIDNHIADLERAFDQKYWPDVYPRIQIFREWYIKRFASQNHKLTFDDILHPEKYKYFIMKLQTVLSDGKFSLASDIYRQEIQNIPLSWSPAHD